ETISGTRDDAERRRFTILNGHEDGSFALPDKLTFGAFFRRWIETRLTLGQIERSTAENYLNIFEKHMRPIAGKRAQKITSQDVQQIYVTMKRAGLSPRTVNHTHKIIVACFTAIRRANLVKVNVMEEIEAPPQPKQKPKAISETEAARLMQELAGS